MSTTNSKRSKKTSRSLQSVEKLRAENTQLRVENRQLRAQVNVFETLVDTNTKFLDLIRHELTSIANSNAPTIVALQKLIDDQVKNRANLATGRAKGAAQNASRATKLHDEWKRIASDLRKHQDTKHLTIAQQAEYIQKNQCGKMKNGKPYSARTIQDVIKGVT